MIQALAIAELGVTVSVFGAGPDGGREATFQVDAPPAATPSAGVWSGYGIVQAKTIRFAQDPAKNASSLVAATRAELDKFVPRGTAKPERTPAPTAYIIATNARLSAAPGGGVDEILNLLATHRVGLTGYAVWHYEHICRLLDLHIGVRKTYAGFVTPGDILARLADVLDGSPGKLGTTLKSHAASQLAARETLKLETTEITDQNKVRLSEVAIDLPGHGYLGVERRVVQHVLEAGDASLRNSQRGENPYGFVILGGPGQGKSTLGQIIAQAYRVGLLEEVEHSITPQIDAAIRDTKACLRDLGLAIPRNRRWPVVIDLAAFADALLDSPALTAVEYVARQLRSQGASIDGGQVAAWLSTWPWLLVLDGLDEVPAQSSRTAVVAALNDLIVESRVGDWDLLVVCTTRPQGYNGEFSELAAEQLTLRNLRPEEGAGYARRIVRAKYGQDVEKAHRIQSDLQKAIEQPHTSRLMQTPLQVTIMEFLVEELAAVPDTRHELFDGYYRAIYARESRKAGRFGQMLRSHQEQVDWVHEQIGFHLQRSSEISGESDVSIAEQAVVDLFRMRLESDEFTGDDVNHLSEELDRAAKQRLVLLVARTPGNLSFEVRPLQEYMAARAIVTGPSDVVYERLATLAPSAYWRNTLQLAIGRLYTTRPHDRDGIIERVRRLNADSTLGSFLGYGSRLAIDLLDDDFANAVPAHRRSMLVLALDQVTRWPGPELKRLASITKDVVNGRDSRGQQLVLEALAEAWRSTGRSRISAVGILRDWEKDAGEAGKFARNRLHSDPSWRPVSDRRIPMKRRSVDAVLETAMDEAGLSQVECSAWERLEDALLKHVTVPVDITPAELVTVSRADSVWSLSAEAFTLLSDPVTLAVVAKVCNSTGLSEAAAPITLRRAVSRVDQVLSRGNDSALTPLGSNLAARS